MQDYIYGYAPMTIWATSAIQTAVSNNTSSPGQAPFNQFSYVKQLAGPGAGLIVQPNTDMLYTQAWLNLATEPVILHVPATPGRYYLIPMLDAYSNVFASIGTRTTGTGAGNYAVVGPFWQGPFPDDANVTAVIKAPTNTVWLLGRTLVNNPSDLAAAVAVTTQYQLIPLSAYPQFLRTGRYTPPGNVPVVPPSSDFEALPVTNSQGFSKPEFFDALLAYSLVNPAPPDQFFGSLGLVLDGFINQSQMTSSVASEANLAMVLEFLLATTSKNGWSYSLQLGDYGTNYLLRATVAKFGLGANLPADAVYLLSQADMTGAPLTGTNSYTIHFSPGQTPPAHGYWSVTVYDQNGFLVANPINRYSAGSQTGLVSNADGSVDIFLQASEPKTMQSNWLPVPPAAFHLNLRIYWPGEAVLNGTWTPPSLSRTL
ncbi:MAG: DUF1254 domain-containing protein [Acidobacteriia bacterium]|nr:DUF1254 domain-containing protein [Terriglobia bacterium]